MRQHGNLTSCNLVPPPWLEKLQLTHIISTYSCQSWTQTLIQNDSRVQVKHEPISTNIETFTVVFVSFHPSRDELGSTFPAQ